MLLVSPGCCGRNTSLLTEMKEYRDRFFFLLMMSGNMRGQVLGVGGELKNTFCLGTGSLFYPSPYIGDMADVRTVNALRESIVRMETLLEIKPEIIACDMHPKYNTTYAAQELARERGIPVFPVQHHYAHIVSCMGAKPLYLSCAFVIEEGFPMEKLEKYAAAMETTAKEAGIRIVAGDTKVAGKGQVDNLFITTTGIGEIM